jgi:hypothetical protein
MYEGRTDFEPGRWFGHGWTKVVLHPATAGA